MQTIHSLEGKLLCEYCIDDDDDCDVSSDIAKAGEEMKAFFG